MILNTTQKISQRYHLLEGAMGNAGDPEDSPNHRYHIAIGIDRGFGYRGYMAVTYFLEQDFVPNEAKGKCRKFLRERGYTLSALPTLEESLWNGGMKHEADQSPAGAI
jgi:hypothetical protein